MKSLRFVKLRTFMKSPADIALEWNHNPLRVEIELKDLDQDFNLRFLAQFKEKIDLKDAATKP